MVGTTTLFRVYEGMYFATFGLQSNNGKDESSAIRGCHCRIMDAVFKDSHLQPSHYFASLSLLSIRLSRSLDPMNPLSVQ